MEEFDFKTDMDSFLESEGRIKEEATSNIPDLSVDLVSFRGEAPVPEFADINMKVEELIQQGKTQQQANRLSFPTGELQPGEDITGDALFQGNFRITQQFGNYNPELYKGITSDSKHKGVDLGTPEGTPLYAPISGKVSIGSDPDGYGNYVLIEDENGYKHRLSHLSAQSVKSGQSIQAGQFLGRTGNTGNSTGPHLDISVVTPRGGFIDPLKLSVYSQLVGQGGTSGQGGEGNFLTSLLDMFKKNRDSEEDVIKGMMTGDLESAKRFSEPMKEAVLGMTASPKAILPEASAKRIAALGRVADKTGDMPTIREVDELLDIAKKYTKIPKKVINKLTPEKLLAELRGLVTPQQSEGAFKIPRIRFRR